MPVHTNSIGPYLFLDIQGTPYVRQQQKEIIERFGVEGTIYRRTGRRGKPFQLQTLNYVDSFSAAHTALLAYRDLCDEDVRQTLILRTVNWGSFMVLEVVETRPPYAIFNSLGGFDGGEEVCHEVTFTLQG